MTSDRPRSLFRSRHAAHVHFVGIGGIGMSGIAEVLVNLGPTSRNRKSPAALSNSARG